MSRTGGWLADEMRMQTLLVCRLWDLVPLRYPLEVDLCAPALEVAYEPRCTMRSCMRCICDGTVRQVTRGNAGRRTARTAQRE